jgi:hypothetical protein
VACKEVGFATDDPIAGAPGSGSGLVLFEWAPGVLSMTRTVSLSLELWLRKMLKGKWPGMVGMGDCIDVGRVGGTMGASGSRFCDG